MDRTWVFVVQREGCARKARIAANIWALRGFRVKLAPLTGIKWAIRSMRCHCKRDYLHRSVNPRACPRCRKIVVIGLFSEASYCYLARSSRGLPSLHDTQMARSEDEKIRRIARAKREFGWTVDVFSYRQSILQLRASPAVPDVDSALLPAG